MVEATEKVISVRDFIHSESEVGVGYRDYWKESNIDKNVFLPHEQLMTIERRIIWSAYKVGMANLNQDHKTPELTGEVLKYHISGESSIHDSIKGLSTDYKRQPACRILKGIGNMGTHAGDPGAAARYTSVRGTPLLASIIKDLKYVPMIVDETGLHQPEYVSTPIPMALINGVSNIGTGHSAYYDERDAREVIDWIEGLVKGEDVTIPDPISSSGCVVYKNPKNGYTYYEARMHREGAYDIITNLPPKISSNIVIAKLDQKLPPRQAKRVEDASEVGRPIWIKIPKNSVPSEDFGKYSMRKARKEATYIWDQELDTMRMSSHEEVAIMWYENRKEIISKRLKHQVESLEKEIQRINLIEKYYKNEMHKMQHSDIVKELGKDDAEVVLSQPARVFLKENVERNAIRRDKLLEEIKSTKEMKAHDVLFKEARSIIEEQEKFFREP